MCTTEPSSEGPFIFELRSGSTLVERFPTTGTTTDTCHTFTVSPTADTTYFGRVISTQDDPDCVKDSPEVLVTVEDITPEIAVGGGGACNTGALTLTATPAGCESYAWFLDDATDAVLDGQPGDLPGEPRQPVPHGARRRRLRRLPGQRVDDDQAVRDHDQPVPVAV